MEKVAFVLVVVSWLVAVTSMVWVAFSGITQPSGASTSVTE